MKPFRLLLIVLCLFVAAHGQQPKPTPAQEEKQQSNIEKFLAKSGTLIERSYVTLGAVKGINNFVKVESLKITDLLSKSSLTGVRFEADTGTGSLRRTTSAFLDSDEVDALLSSLKHLKSVAGTTRPNYTEIEYRSRSGFSAGGFFDEKDKKWSFFVRLSRYESNSSIYFDESNLDLLQSLVLKSKP